MNWIRKGLGLLLALCTVLSLAGTAYAAQPIRYEQTVVNPHYAGWVTEDEINAACAAIRAEAPARTLDTPSFGSIDAAGEYLREQMVQRVSSVSFWLVTDEEQNFSANMRAIMKTAVTHTGVPTEGDYLDFQYGGYRAGASGYSDQELCYTLTITYYTTAEQEAGVTQRLSSVMPSIRSASGEYARVKAIYDYICDNVTYDYEHLDDDDYHLKATAYAALVNGTAVCQGYAALFYRMALEAGIDARIIASDEIDHAWNIARIGTKYYYLDSTWDAGKTGYDYFLRGSSDFSGHENEDDPYNDASFSGQYPLAAAKYVPSSGVTITAQPKDFTGKVGDTATFTVKATGDGIQYQWQYSDNNGKTWSNSTAAAESANCKITAGRDGRLYRCIVTDSSGSEAISASAKITVLPGPVITAQPKDYKGKVGDTATFTVKATGDRLRYQWQYSDNNGKTWSNSTAAAESANCKITAGRDGRLYRCIITDGSGSSVTSNPAKITVQKTALKITAQPKNDTNKVGQTATFTVKATGDGLQYQWQYSDNNGKTWSNSAATTESANCKITAARDGRLYRCIITDAYGSKVTSASARLIVGTPLKITTQPKDFTGKSGETATFTVKAAGDGLKYQWQYSDNSGNTWSNSSSITAAANCKITAGRDGRLYRCIITDQYSNLITSSSGRLQVG